MNVSQFVTPEFAVHCRNCNPGMFSDEPTTWRCYLGDLDGRRSIVVFECVACGQLRYLDLLPSPAPRATVPG